MFSLWRKARRENSAASRLLGSTSLRFALHGWQRLSGSIPDSFAGLASRAELHLHANKLSGLIPSELADLPITEVLVRYNALHTTDQKLIDLIDGHDLDWQATQTIAPADVQPSNITSNSITLQWTPIEHQDNGGGYQVFFSTDPLGPYDQDGGTTADKSIGSLPVPGLTTNTDYYFVVKTWTDPHTLNSNLVWSEPGRVVCINTGSGACPDDDGDGLPNALDRDEHMDTTLILPAGEKYGDRSDGSGNTSLSSCTAIETQDSSQITILAPHKMILQASEIRILAGVIFKVQRGAELLIGDRPETCM